jgi:hypothetical protein
MQRRTARPVAPRAPTPAEPEAVRAARAEGAEEAREIARLCVQAGQPERAADFFRSGTRLTEVRAALGLSDTPATATGSPRQSARAFFASLTREQIDAAWEAAFSKARSWQRPP